MTNINDIARDKHFLRLHRELSKFNIFHATGMKNQEIKHTQFLGYLLDPNESHGLKDEFLIRFIQSLPNRVSVNMLDFNLSYARVIKEKSFFEIENNNNQTSKKKKKIRIDLIIEIPSLSECEKIYVFTIENKIRAAEGENQLKKYKDTVNSEYPGAKERIFLYLNISEDEVSDDTWIPIRYSETIIPAVSALIEDQRETLSDYMIFILKDYIEFINQEGEYESNNTLEDIVAGMSESSLRCIQELPKTGGNLEQQRLYTRYKHAFDYVRNYDADPRAAILKHFQSQFDEKTGLHRNFSTFRLETSNINYMRFSFLSAENGRKLSESCNNPEINWLKSQRNLAFQFNLIKLSASHVKFRVSLYLGPTGKDYAKRSELLRAIREALGVEDRGAGQFFDSVKQHGYRKYSRANLSVEGAKKWIDDSFKKLADDEKEDIEGINERLEKFFCETALQHPAQ